MVKMGSDEQCWLWMGARTRVGYGQVCVGGPGTPRRNRSAHRIAWEASRGPIPPEKWVLHSCDVRSCCNPSHMYLGNRGMNAADMRNRERSLCGIRNPKAKLTENQMREVRRLKGLLSGAELGRRFGVTRATISKIQLGKTWKHWAPREPSRGLGG